MNAVSPWSRGRNSGAIHRSGMVQILISNMTTDMGMLRVAMAFFRIGNTLLNLSVGTGRITVRQAGITVIMFRQMYYHSVTG